MIPILLEQFIIEAFQDIPGEGFWTLAEADFSDTSPGPFNFPYHPYDYRNNIYKDNMKTFVEDIARWDKKHKEAALHAVTHNTPMINPYPNWQDIPYSYLNNHFSGFSFCDEKTFHFYTPVAMLGYLKFRRDGNLGIESWCSRLDAEAEENRLEAFLSPFSKYQLLALIEFLSFYIDFATDSIFVDAETASTLHKIKKIYLKKLKINIWTVCPLEFPKNEQSQNRSDLEDSSGNLGGGNDPGIA